MGQLVVEQVRPGVLGEAVDEAAIGRHQSERGVEVLARQGESLARPLVRHAEDDEDVGVGSLDEGLEGVRIRRPAALEVDVRRDDAAEGPGRAVDRRERRGASAAGIVEEAVELPAEPGRVGLVGAAGVGGGSDGLGAVMVAIVAEGGAVEEHGAVELADEPLEHAGADRAAVLALEGGADLNEARPAVEVADDGAEVVEVEQDGAVDDPERVLEQHEGPATVVEAAGGEGPELRPVERRHTVIPAGRPIGRAEVGRPRARDRPGGILRAIVATVKSRPIDRSGQRGPLGRGTMNGNDQAGGAASLGANGRMAMALALESSPIVDRNRRLGEYLVQLPFHQPKMVPILDETGANGRRSRCRRPDPPDRQLHRWGDGPTRPLRAIGAANAQGRGGTGLIWWRGEMSGIFGSIAGGGRSDPDKEGDAHAMER
jgi:hypothetical protein